MKKRIVMYVFIIIICVVAVGVGIHYMLTNTQTNKKEKNPIDTAQQEKLEGLKSNFDKLFSNAFYNNGEEINNTIKKDASKELAYTGFISKAKQEGKYELNVSIPIINITSSVVDEMNTQIQNTFVTKTRSILAESTQKTIYSVEYVAYQNGDILSLVIKSTLKEGDNPQRVIMQSYNYDMKNNVKLSLADVLATKGISVGTAQQTINQSIAKEAENAQELKQLGYTVYSRDRNSGMYKVENTKVYMIGPESYIYVIYPYGNSNYTSETDIIIF